MTIMIILAVAVSCIVSVHCTVTHDHIRALNTKGEELVTDKYIQSLWEEMGAGKTKLAIDAKISFDGFSYIPDTDKDNLLSFKEFKAGIAIVKGKNGTPELPSVSFIEIFAVADKDHGGSLNDKEAIALGVHKLSDGKTCDSDSDGDVDIKEAQLCLSEGSNGVLNDGVLDATEIEGKTTGTRWTAFKNDETGDPSIAK